MTGLGEQDKQCVPGGSPVHARPLFLGQSNPFATRFVRPGAIPFEFPPGLDARRLLARLEAQGWRGAIVGPHGSGKSTLLAALLAELRNAGHSVAAVSLHEGQRRLGPCTPLLERPDGDRRQTLLAIDGYEQLGLVSRWLVQRQCRRRDIGLLVTTHRPSGLPTLFETRPTAELAARLADRLLGGHAPPSWPQAVERSFQAHRGNLREVLFDLYDLYESQRTSRI